MSNRVYDSFVPFFLGRFVAIQGAVLFLALLPAVPLGLTGCASDTILPPGDAGLRDPDAGPQFQTVTIPSVGSPEPNFFDVWGTSTREVYLVGERGTVVRGDGQGWVVEPTPTTADLRGVWGYTIPDPAGGPDTVEVYAVGSGGTVLRRSGSGASGVWTQETSTTTKDLRVVRGRPRDRIWAAGVDGVIATKDLAMPASGWELDDSGTVETIHGLWIEEGGRAGAAVGNLGLVLRLDDRTWARQRIDGLSVPLQGVWGTAADRLWIVGLDGTILRSRESGFDEIPGAPAFYLRRVVGLDFGDVWMTAWGGAILHVTGNEITVYDSFSDHRLEGIWPTLSEPVPDPDDPDGGTLQYPVYYVVGVTGQVLVGP